MKRILVAILIVVLAVNCEATTACDVDGLTPSKIGTHTLNISQVFLGFSEWRLWTINLCEPTSAHPAEAASGCDTPGYINEFDYEGTRTSIECIISWPNISTSYAKNATTGDLDVTFINYEKSWIANDHVSCGGDTALNATSDVFSTNHRGNLVFEFNLQSNILCGSSAPIPPPVPTVAPAPCDVGGLTPSKIGTQTLAIDQIFLGTPSPYFWTINPRTCIQLERFRAPTRVTSTSSPPQMGHHASPLGMQ